MEIPRLAQLRPRTVLDIVDDAFDLYRERFALLAGISAMAYIPVLLLVLAISINPFLHLVEAFGKRGPDAEDAAGFAILQMGGVLLLAFPLVGIAQLLQFGATSIVVEGHIGGIRTTIFSAWKRMLQRFFVVLATSVIVGLFNAVVSYVLTAIAQLFIAPFLAFIPQAILLERNGISGAIRRSMALAGQGYWRTMGLLLLGRLIGVFLGCGILAIVVAIVALLFSSGLESTDKLAEASRWFTILFLSIGVAMILVAPLIASAMTLLYYDMRIRREGIDIESIALEIGYPLAPDYFGGVGLAPTPQGRR